MIEFYSNSGKVKLHTYTVDGNVVEVRDGEGKHVIKCLRNPNGGEWTDVEKNAWGKKTAYEYNISIAEEAYKKLINDLDKVYVDANKSNVVLSDGNVFGASKAIGDDHNVSIKNSIDLIKSGCELAVYAKAPSITLSDVYNKDVTYEFNYDSPVPAYILPIVELAERTAIFFEVKRVLRNAINSMKENDFANLDNMVNFNVRVEFDKAVLDILKLRYPDRYRDPEEYENEPVNETEE